MPSILLKQAFSADLAKNIFPDNAFYKNSKDDSAFIEANAVNLPHAGVKPTTVVDRASFPGAISQRTDSATVYPIQEISSNPTHLQYSEELVVNYAKRASILEDHKATLQDGIADQVAFNWGRGGDSENAWTLKPLVIRSTGTATRAVNVATVGVAVTGVRKRFVLADILGAQTALNRQDMKGQRIAVITADMLEDFLLIDQFANSNYNKIQPLTQDGMITFDWMGFKFYVRSRVNVFATAGTIKAVGATTAATDCAGGIFYTSTAVRRAEGGVKVFLDEERPEYYGSLMSAAVRFGAIGARKDGLGVVNVVEAN